MEVDVLPILEIDPFHEIDYYEALEDIVKKRKTLPLFEDIPLPTSEEEYTDVAHRWKKLLLSRRVMGMDRLGHHARALGYPFRRGDPYAAVTELIGTERHAYRPTDLSQEYGMTMVCKSRSSLYFRWLTEYNKKNVMSNWSSNYVAGVTWFNEPAHREMALSYIAYGNEASIDTMYSSAAILAIIPPFEERQALLSKRA